MNYIIDIKDGLSLPFSEKELTALIHRCLDAKNTKALEDEMFEAVFYQLKEN